MIEKAGMRGEELFWYLGLGLASCGLLIAAWNHNIYGVLGSLLLLISIGVQQRIRGRLESRKLAGPNDFSAQADGEIRLVSSEGYVEQRRSQGPSRGGEQGLLKVVLEAMQEGVVAVNHEQKILFANRSARPLLDSAARAYEGRPLWEVARFPEIQEFVQRAIHEGKPQHLESTVQRTKSVVSISALPLPGTEIPGVLLVFQDVTELRRLENLRREFVGNVSHELKTPLTSIQAYAETLLSGGLEDGENNRGFVERIYEQAERLRALILDLLRLAQIESGEVVYEKGPVDVGEVLAECVEELREKAGGSGVTLVYSQEGVTALVEGDGEGLFALFSNLIDNGIKYTPRGGEVRVRCRQDGLQVVVEIEDTGIGIAKDQQERIFERFYRVDRARSRAMGGTGLGLSIVKHLSQVFGGSVDVTSELGKGSVFRVRLPRLKAE